MKQRLPVLGLMGASLAIYGFRAQPPAAPDLSTPKSTVKSFLNALIARNAGEVAACVRGAQSEVELNRLLQSDSGPLGRVTGAEVVSMIGEAEGEQAKVAVEVTLQAPPVLDPQGARVALSVVEVFALQRENGQWRIVPDAAIKRQLADSRLVGTRFELRPLATLCALAASPASVLRETVNTHSETQTVACVSNVRQVALATTMYAQDFDETFPRSSAALNTLIKPYLRDQSALHCPLDAKDAVSYAFNPNLQGMARNRVLFPNRTVLVYEGKNGKLAFKHNGRACVAFVDGHAQLLTPEQSKVLFWSPTRRTPTEVLPGRAAKRRNRP